MTDKERSDQHLKNREWMVASLAGEIFGPGGRFEGWKNDLYSEATEIDIKHNHIFPTWNDYNKRYIQADTKQEILKEEGPLRHYGVGILFPDEVVPAALGADRNESEADEEASAAEEAAIGTVSDDDDQAPESEDEPKVKSEQKLRENAAKLSDRLFSHAIGGDEGDAGHALSDVDEETDPSGSGLSLCRTGKPRSMGVSFAADLTGSGSLKITLTGARYKPIEDIGVRKEGSDPEKKGNRTWWLRIPVSAECRLTFEQLRRNTTIHPDLSLEPSGIDGLEPLMLQVTVLCRELTSDITPLYPEGARLLTVTLVNRTKKEYKQAADCCTFFQSRFTVTPTREDGAPVILPYPGLSRRKLDAEEESLELLYNKVKMFATGHGCAGEWEANEGADRASSVIAEPMPVYQTPPVTPVLIDPMTNMAVDILMAPFAKLGEVDRDARLQPLDRLAELYSIWINELAAESKRLDARFQAAAVHHIEVAQGCLKRINKGLQLLRDDDDAWLAFRLTNRAMLTQQIAGRLDKRTISYDQACSRIVWSSEFKAPDPDTPNLHNCWRPFQIAFLLMSLPGLWDGSTEDSGRNIADLIWFPTGGGKTEAYLAATAFTLFARRLHDPNDNGTGVLMRYTLRLLTAQQFQRASGLICSMEAIRLSMCDRLGETPYRIGIWVGGDTTPNKTKESVVRLQNAQRNGLDDYAHALLRCPWCGSVMGPRKRNYKQKEPGASYYICDGLRLSGKGDDRHVVLHCPDPKCHLFHKELPVCVVDEEIYKNPPSLIIGTVDKFAMLAWKPEARSIFGIGPDGKHSCSPPALIIQDELHLITGPLGSMVGLYEGLIEELCTDRRGPRPVLPKLIAATATTRASARQIRDLYAREETAVFPPPGLDAADSFFARYERDENGKIKPGRMYLGVLARGYGSGLTVNVRVFAALLAAVPRLPEEQRDPWWTLLVFYNSLRELGANFTLFGADIPERLRDLQRRWYPGDNRRFLREVNELTGRLSNSEVPQAIDKLERVFGKHKYPVDACLASNIIEVGVDVSRLGIMAVSGQPKTMAQYIQATGRVGRSQPGLVVMVYDNRKARDLSHFEHFQTDHARLYAQVEPSSVTPFTLPVLERAVHGVLIAWLRQRLPESSLGQVNNPQRYFVQEYTECARQLLRRVRILFKCDPAACSHAEKNLKGVLSRRWKEWQDQKPTVWSTPDLTSDVGELPLMRFYGNPCRADWIDLVWETPSSMRGVDAECSAMIFTPFNDATASDEEDPLETL